MRRALLPLACLAFGVIAGGALATIGRHVWRTYHTPAPIVFGMSATNAPASSGGVSTGGMRRVVTGHDALGRSVILSDGPPPFEPRFGDERFIEIWRTTSSPAILDAAPSVEPTSNDIKLSQPDGSMFRVVDYDPPAAGGRRTPTHRTKTIDYAIVMEGEIVLILDDSEVTLHAGDVVVQRGTNHAWENRSKARARVAFVLLDADFSPALREKLPAMKLTP
jgi:hypothetical protein